jgi:hypothetical protein
VRLGVAPFIQVGQIVAVIARLFNFWLLNACRIVYVVDEAGPIQRYGFAYGTLPEHAESAKSGSPWSGTRTTMRYRMTLWLSRARSNSWFG